MNIKDFTSIGTGGGCTALQYIRPDGYALMITDEDCGIPPINDTNIVIGLYPDEECNDYINMYYLDNAQELGITFSLVEKDIANDKKYKDIKKDIGLSSIDRVIIEYYTNASDIHNLHEMFDVSDLEWTPQSMEEDLHRILGHTKFVITKIYH